MLCAASFLRVVKLPDKQMVSKCLGSMSDPTAAMAACSNEPELKSTEALLFTRNRYRTHTSYLPGLSFEIQSRRILRLRYKFAGVDSLGGLWALRVPCSYGAVQATGLGGVL